MGSAVYVEFMGCVDICYECVEMSTGVKLGLALRAQIGEENIWT